MKNNRLFLMVLASVMAVPTLGGMVANATPENVNTSTESTDSTVSTAESTIVNAIANFEPSVDLSNSNITLDEFKKIFSRLTSDYPQFFYLNKQYSYCYNAEYGIFIVNFTYDTDKDSYAEEKQLIDNKFSEITSQLSDTMTDYEKALLVHDYLCSTFNYDYTYSNYSVLDLVKTENGVCEAYTGAYTYILNELGIECFSVQSDSIDHMWNMVKLDGKYYHVDVTWDDCMSGIMGYVGHDNFLVTDETINQTHSTDWTTNYENVSATDSTYENYSFKQSTSAYIPMYDDVYCLHDGKLCRYNFSTDTLDTISNALEGYKWYNLTANNGSFYLGYYSDLIGYKDIMIYNTPTSIVITNETGQILDTIYNHNDSNTLIYGIDIQNGNLVAQLENDLDFSRTNFGFNTITICNMDSFYQDRVSPRTDIQHNPQAQTSFLSVNLVGDVNLDNEVNCLDLVLLTKSILTNGDYQNVYDLNDDGSVNVIDVMILKKTIFENMANA